MTRLGLLICFLSVCLCSHAQSERVYMQLDKYSCTAGDTVWFKGYVFQGEQVSSLSTNLYAELYTENAVLLSRSVFPIFRGGAAGQFVVPDSLPSGNYFIRAFTRQQLSFDSGDLFTVPVHVQGKNKLQRIMLKKKIPVPDAFAAGSVKGVFWVTSVYGSEISSMLSVDSGDYVERKFHVIKQLPSDSALSAEIILNATIKEQYASFPRKITDSTATFLLFEDSLLIGAQTLRLKQAAGTISLVTDTLDNGPSGYNSWRVTLADAMCSNVSVAVTDADKDIEPPINIQSLNEPLTENFAKPVQAIDNGFISFTGNATKLSGKLIKADSSQEIMMAGVKDSSFLFAKVVPINANGHFSIDSLFFFGDMDLQFQINKDEDGSTKDIKLALTKFIPPTADSVSLIRDWQDDTATTIVTANQNISSTPDQKSDFGEVKSLKAVTVKAWRSARKELDDRYTGGAFSEPALYSFDVRTERRYTDLGSYLRINYPRFQGGFSSSDTPKDEMGHQFLFFVDEQNYTWPELQMFDWEKIAYIKCFESEFIGDDDFIRWKNNISTSGFSLQGSPGTLKTPVAKTPIIISIYTRKGNDFRTMPGGLNRISVKGYSKILKFNPGKTTLYWTPFVFANHFRIQFTNNEITKRFRVVIEGVDSKGQIIHLEKIID